MSTFNKLMSTLDKLAKQVFELPEAKRKVLADLLSESLTLDTITPEWIEAGKKRLDAVKVPE